jgi:pimeloyl-ACP methyl ester carboxylesterase
MALDLRGHGNSDRACDGQYNLDAYVSDVEGVIAQLDLSELVLIGHSLGAQIVAQLACTQSQRVRAVVFVDGGPYMREDVVGYLQHKFESQSWSHPSVFEYAALLGKNLPFAARETLEGVATAALRPTASGRFELKADPRLRINMGVTRTAAVDAWQALVGTAFPILLARGSASGLLSKSGAQQTENALPNCRAVTIARAGHAVMLDNPRKLALEIREFIRRIDPVARASRTGRTETTALTVSEP